jgi:hypothetical protein
MSPSKRTKIAEPPEAIQIVSNQKMSCPFKIISNKADGGEALFASIGVHSWFIIKFMFLKITKNPQKSSVVACVFCF